MRPEERLKELGITIPKPPTVKNKYVGCVQTGNLIFLSGHGPAVNNTPYYKGRVGEERSEKEGYDSARICGINLLARLNDYMNGLDQVTKIVSIRGYVNSAPDFYNQSQVIDGVSDLMIDVFGSEIGTHSRVALGVAVLPGNITTEVEMVVEVSG